MKKVVSLILCAVMLLSAMPVSADALWDAIMNIPRNEAPDVFLNSVEISFDGDAFPQNVNGRVLVPFRAIAESYGATVLYDEETKAITAKRGDVTISFRNGDYNMTVTQNGVESTVTMDVCPTLNTEYNRTMVPIRFLSEAFGLSVGWTGEDVVVADYRGLLEEIVENNALLTAIRDTRAQNPAPFMMQKEKEYWYRAEPSPAFPEDAGDTTWEDTSHFSGVHHATPSGILFEGTKDYYDFISQPDGEYTYEYQDVPYTEINKNGMEYWKEEIHSWYIDEGRMKEEARALDEWYIKDNLSGMGATSFLTTFIIHALTSAKPFDECVEEAILWLEYPDGEETSYHYSAWRRGLLIANELYREESLVETVGTLDFFVTEEEYRERIYDGYEVVYQGSDEFFDFEGLKESLKQNDQSFSLKVTFSEQGDVVAVVYEESFYEDQGGLTIISTEQSESYMRIPGIPSDAVAPEKSMTYTELMNARKDMWIN